MKLDIQVLKRFSSLRLLSDEELLHMSQAMSPLKAPTNGLLHKQGTKERNFFLLEKGEVEISTELPDGKTIVLATIKEGEVFGQGALVMGSGQALEFRAKTDVELLLLPAHLHAWSLERGERWAIKLQRAVCYGVVKIMRKTLEDLTSLAASEKDAISKQNEVKANHEDKLLELLGKTEISCLDLEDGDV
ncbi:MAG: cyclic nucleotide-binding domain-containing protein [Myxococcota bacterium]|nr:cyclic nucleotide-binding domain-containing protein [Myxococcota bacterium]